jgi:hypothetical protein
MSQVRIFQIVFFASSFAHCSTPLSDSFIQEITMRSTHTRIVKNVKYLINQPRVFITLQNHHSIVQVYFLLFILVSSVHSVLSQFNQGIFSVTVTVVLLELPSSVAYTRDISIKLINIIAVKNIFFIIYFN